MNGCNEGTNEMACSFYTIRYQTKQQSQNLFPLQVSVWNLWRIQRTLVADDS